jgi:hypothetical protein
MANRKTYIIKANEEGGWDVWAEESDRPLNVFKIKGEAVERAAELARKQEPSKVVIYKKDGDVQEERLFGEDAGPKYRTYLGRPKP